MAKPTNSTPIIDLHPNLHNLHIDAKMYGAVGSPIFASAVDDTTAIQAAINAAASIGDGVTVTVPTTVDLAAGMYYISSSLTIPTGVILQGAGRRNTILFHNAGSNPCIQVGPGTGGAQHVGIKDLTIWKAAGGTGDGISLAGDGTHPILQTVIDGVRFFTVGDATHWAIRTNWALETYIMHCSMEACGGGGIWLGDTSNGSVVRDNTISNNGAGAIGGVNVQANGCLIEGNIIEAWRGSYGVKITGQHTSLIRNWIEDVYGIAIDLSTAGSSDVSIIGNNVSTLGASQTYCLDINQGKYIVVAQNSLTFGTNGARVRSGAAGNQHSIVTFIANEFLAATGGRIDFSGLSNTQDAIVRIGERRDDHIAPAFEIIAGHARLAPGSSLGWKPSLDGEIDINLYRAAANQLKTDDTFIGADGVATKTKAGTPVDGDFATTPPVGTMVVDTSANKIWVRTGAATWKGVVVA